MLETLQQNLVFVIISAIIVVLIALGAKYSEKYCKDLHQVRPARRITLIAICGAIASILHILDFPLLFRLRNSTSWTSPSCPSCSAAFTWDPPRLCSAK